MFIQKQNLLPYLTLVICFLLSTSSMKAAQDLEKELIFQLAKKSSGVLSSQLNQAQKKMQYTLKGDPFIVRKCLTDAKNAGTSPLATSAHSPLDAFNPQTDDINTFIGNLTPDQVTQSAYVINKNLTLAIIESAQGTYEKCLENLHLWQPFSILLLGPEEASQRLNDLQQNVDMVQSLFKATFAHTRIATEYDLSQHKAKPFVEKIPPKQLSAILIQYSTNISHLINISKAIEQQKKNGLHEEDA